MHSNKFNINATSMKSSNSSDLEVIKRYHQSKDSNTSNPDVIPNYLESKRHYPSLYGDMGNKCKKKPWKEI